MVPKQIKANLVKTQIMLPILFLSPKKKINIFAMKLLLTALVTLYYVISEVRYFHCSIFQVRQYYRTTKTMAPNKLGSERSPYLLQHASNPVNWYPWGEEAFQAAKESNKLIFLSVGYSTCHWCHVMERESFESSEVMKINKVVLRNLFYDLPFLGTCS